MGQSVHCGSGYKLFSFQSDIFIVIAKCCNCSCTIVLGHIENCGPGLTTAKSVALCDWTQGNIRNFVSYKC